VQDFIPYNVMLAWYLLWAGVYVLSVCLSVTRQCSNEMDSAHFLHRGFPQPALHCVVKKFGYAKTKVTYFLLECSPNSELR